MRLFLSYASEDLRVAEEVYFALLGNGHKVYFDRSSLQPGDNYDRLLRQQVDSSDAIIFLISPRSVEQGSYTLTELKYAREKWNHPEGRVLPVMIRPTPFKDIPTYLGAVTVLQPVGNVAAEVSDVLEGWKPSRRSEADRGGLTSTAGGFVAFLVLTILIAIGLGTLFSFAYPTVEGDFGLALVFLLVAAMLVLVGRGLWRITLRFRQSRR